MVPVVVVVALALGSATPPVVRADARVVGVSTPAQWDPAIAPIAAAVERIRGLRFRHPVAVVFQDDATFDATIIASASELTADEEAQLTRQLAELRALGLVPAGVNVHDLYGTPDPSNILAYYDPQTQQISVRGTDLSPAHRMTIAHELTHALDDQWFDLAAMQERAATSSRWLMVEDLVEGDAERVELAYRLTMSGADQAAAEDELSAESSDTEVGEGVPADAVEVFGALQYAPYLVGPDMVDTVLGKRGQSGLDAWFRVPPASDEPAYDPLYAAAPHPRVAVATPRLTKGETRDGPVDDLGPLTLYLVLASRLDPADALRAADGWAGDASVSFKKDGRQCLRTTVAGHDRAGTTRLDDALRAYAAAVTGGGVDVVRDDARHVTFTACDPGARARVPTAWAGPALRQISLRNQFLATVLAGGLGRAASECTADKILDDPVFRTVVQSGVALTPAERDALWQRFVALEAACRTGTASPTTPPTTSQRRS